MSNWINKRPKEYLKDVKRLFGSPTFIANVENGMAYWKMSGSSLFAEHILKDEDVKHCVPAPHHDFFYTSIKIYVPPMKLLNVLKISGSISYDGLKHFLTARCGGFNANIATLYLGAKIAMGEYNIEKLKKDNLYIKHIQEKVLTYREMLSELHRLKRKNKKRYAK